MKVTFIEKIYCFLNAIISRITGREVQNSTPLLALAESSDVQSSASFNVSDEDNSSDDLMEERINVAKRTLMTKLYNLEQEIAVFEDDFPSEYQNFLQRIDEIRASYNSSLESLEKLLTFEIDPETDTTKIDEVIRLENEIKRFIDTTVKFHIISKRLQRLIKKLNILYNVSILHSSECEKEKVCTQLKHAIQSESKLAEEFKTCDHILQDKQLKERIIELLSYVDYEIFKSAIRNSSNRPEILIENLVMKNQFDDFDYGAAFIAFIKDELSDLLELLPLVSDMGCRNLLKAKSDKLLTNLTYADDLYKIILCGEFWEDFLSLESTLIEMLKVSGVEKEKSKVKLICRMDIKVNENDVLVSPITTANFALVSIFATTHDERIMLLIKLLKKISKDTTYKEIYFLLVLFDALGVVENTPNDLIKHIEKYISRYPYNHKTIEEKKREVFSSSNKEYVVIFSLDDYADAIVNTLENLKFDFKVENGNVFVNSFYFNGLENVLSSLQTNTNNV